MPLNRILTERIEIPLMRQEGKFQRQCGKYHSGFVGILLYRNRIKGVAVAASGRSSLEFCRSQEEHTITMKIIGLLENTHHKYSHTGIQMWHLATLPLSTTQLRCLTTV